MSALTLAQAKTHLDIPSATTTYDTELQAVIDSAEATLAERVGPLVSTATTRRVAGGNSVLALPITPAISLTSVTPNSGAALTLTDLYLDPNTGLVEYNIPRSFPAPYYTVVYAAGRTTCPSDLLFAVKELVRHLWRPRQGPRSTTSASTDELTPGSAHALPYRITELIAPHVRVGVG